MKFRNILSILFFLVVAASCSMESDTVMNDISNEMDVALETNKEAYISLLVNSDMPSTKAVAGGGLDSITDQDINTLAIFLLEGDKVIYNVYLGEGEFSIENGTLKTRDGKVFGILTKKKDKLNLLTVANTSEKILNKTTREAIKQATATLSDCTKFAETTITWGNYPGYEKINGTEGALMQPAFSAAVTLKQSYARVELTEFNVVKQAGSAKDVDVVLTSVELFNVNKSGRIDGTETPASLVNATETFTSFSCNTSDKDCLSTSGKNIITNKDVFFRTFAYDYSKVTDASKMMKMKLTYKVGVKTRTKIFTIEGSSAGANAVVAGSIYRMRVTATLRAEQVDCEVIFSVKHWIDGGSLVDGDGDMTEVK